MAASSGKPPKPPTATPREPRGGFDDTSIGGHRHGFPQTPSSAVLGAGSDDVVARARAFQVLVRAYWKPVYKTIRLRFRKSNEEAKDLTQGFFTRAFEKEVFGSYDPARARFRTFMRTCLDNYVANEEQARRRLKRGGGMTLLSLDFDAAERELHADSALAKQPDDGCFDREWAKALLELGVEELRGQLNGRGKELHFELFSRYDLVDDPEDRPTYANLADEMAIKVTDVTNYLALARREFRRIVLEHLRELTANDEEFEEEARSLLGVDPV